MARNVPEGITGFNASKNLWTAMLSKIQSLKTSNLQNDGDGESPFATEEYVGLNGGKIDKIKVNNVEQQITNKTVNISVPTKPSDINAAELDASGKVPTSQLPAMNYEPSGAVSSHNSSGTAHSDIRQTITSHSSSTNNPHSVTAAQVGAIPTSDKGKNSGVATLGSDGKVPTSQLPAMNYEPSGTVSSHNSSGTAHSDIRQTITSHSNNKSNPHSVTAAQVNAIPTSDKGKASGVATLGSGGKLTASQLPANTTTVTLSSSNWSNKTQTVNVTGVTASNIVQISASSKAAADDWTGNEIWCTAQQAGKLTFTCTTVPTNNIVLNALIWG